MPSSKYVSFCQVKKIEKGLCAYVLINVSPSQYERDWSKYETQIVKELAKHEEVESLDIIAGEWNIILKVRTKDQSEFSDFLGKVVNRVAIQKKHITSLVAASQKRFHA